MSKTTDPTVERVRALMERHGWNQGQTAAYLGVPQGTFGNWLQGTRKPSQSVVRLLDVLGIVENLAPWLHTSLLPSKKGD